MKLPPIEEALAQLESSYSETPQVPINPQLTNLENVQPSVDKQLPPIDEIVPKLDSEPYQPTPTQTMPESLPPIEQALKTIESPPNYDVQSPISPVEITQTFNQPSQYDVFSGGVNTGVDYATLPGTPVILPEGEWEIEEAFAESDPTGGYIGNFDNQGYGNSVVAKNRQTGEKLRLSHLSKVGVQPGQIINGGLIGETGSSGNVTGPHLDAEMYDSQGNLSDILQSPYANIIPHK